MFDDLLAGLRRRDRRSLARLITLASRGQFLDDIRRLGPALNPARVLAITGAGGVGKSSLVGKLIEQWRTAGKRVAVLACDPESPLTGGALLGDRFRMTAGANDAGVFIRSLAATSGRQAVADHLDAVVSLCEHFGFDIVLIETVGAGQGDTAVRSLADAVVLLLQPETGDDLQWEKAGVLEVADLVVIHKADLPGADRAVAQVQAALALAGGREVRVLAVSSRTGVGLPELVATIESLPQRSHVGGSIEDFLQAVRYELSRRLNQPEYTTLLADWQVGRITTAEAIRRIMH